MARRSRRSGKQGSKRSSSSTHARSSGNLHPWPVAAIALGFVLLAGIAGLYALGLQLHWVLQRALGIVIVALAVVTYLMATRRSETEEEVLVRLRRGQSADFGKRIRESANQPRMVRLPAVGEVGLRTLGAVVVGLMVAGWWLTPLGPVEIRRLSVQDITSQMTDEIKAVVLALADHSVVVAQPPVVPARARELAQRITEESDAYQRGLKATASGRFDDAVELLSTAAETGDVPSEKIGLAQAINAVYAARPADAAARYEELLTSNPTDADLLCQTAVAWMQAGQFAKAEPLVDRAVGICDTGDEELARLLAAALHARAAVLLALSEDLSEAHAAATRSCNLWTEALGEDHPFVATSRNNQAAIYVLQANYSGARELFRWAVEGWTGSLGAGHPHVATGLGNLALVDLAEGAFSRAGNELDRALSLRQTVLPNAHPAIALSYCCQARLALALGQYKSAETAAARAVTLAEKSLGNSHPSIASITAISAAAQAGQARHAKAEASYRLAIDVFQPVFGPRHPCMILALDGLGDVYLARGRVDDVGPLAERMSEIAEETFGKRHPANAPAQVLRGRMELGRGAPGEATPHFEEALDVLRAAFGEQHPDIARVLGYRALSKHSSEPAAYQTVVEEYRTAVAMAEKFYGKEHPEIARLWFGLGQLNLMAHKYPEARAALDRALRIQEKMLTTFHPDLAATYSTYAKLLSKSQPADSRRAAEMRRKADEVRARYEQVNSATTR